VSKAGTLYVVATPIGNLKDITLRALEILKVVDLIVVENKGRALKLLNSYGLRKRLISLASYKEERKIPSLLTLLKEGKNLALTASAGTPCISDPGRAFVRACLKEGIDVRAVPGPSALSASVSIAGLSAERFLFYGFLPKKKGEKAKVLRELSSFPFAIVFFESKQRLLKTLRALEEHFPQREATLLKELTKLHEEVISGKMADLIERLEAGVLQGEYTIIVDGLER
jgi:16S rRNA (cytidine1402-2'-O)-methyltransferase